MKKFATIFTVLLMASGLVVSAYAGPGQDKKAEREQKKKEKRAKLEQQFEKTSQMIQQKTFVLEANWLSDKYGSRIPVEPNLNFISIDSSDVVLQIGSNGNIGYNGVGGVTLDGQLTSWKVRKNDKKLNYMIQANVMTPIGIFDISMMVSADGQTNASITGLRNGQLNYTGNIVPLDMSRVYKGQTLY